MSVVALNSSPPAASPPAVPLKPKEHGAYAILLIPMLTAICAAGPSVVGVCVVAAAITGFLAHEPLLVAVGHRGPRAQRSTPAATQRLVMLLGLTITGGVLALWLGDLPVKVALAACALLASLSFAIAYSGQHRSMAGQLLAVVGLSIPCLPILLAGGLTNAQALETWGTWLIGFSSTTIAVRAVIAAQKRQSRWFHWSALIFLSLLVAFSTLSPQLSLPVVTTPMLVMSWYLLWAPPPAKYLKRVGWTLVAGTLASAVWMTLAL